MTMCQSAPKVVTTSGENVNTTLRKEHEDLKRRLRALDKVLTKTMETVEEVRTKHRKLLCGNVSKNER